MESERTKIFFRNKSTVVTEDQVKVIAWACSRQVHRDFAPAWGVVPAHVGYLAPADPDPARGWVIAILDDSDQQGALGYHAETPGSDVAYARVFAKTILDYGGGVYTGGTDPSTTALSVSSCASHEVLEALADPDCNLWTDVFDGRGTQVALEVADPVESDVYNLKFSHVFKKYACDVSNFVLPSWFDANNTSGKFDFMGTTDEPFMMSPGGYYLRRQAGQVRQAFGKKYDPRLKQLKKTDLSRTYRRVTNRGV